MEPAEKLISLLEEYESIIKNWASAKATFNKGTEIRKVQLQLSATAADAKTSAERTRLAYISKDYHDKLNELFTQEVMFHRLDARKKYLELAIDVHRSIGSWGNKIDNFTK